MDFCRPLVAGVEVFEEPKEVFQEAEEEDEDPAYEHHNAAPEG